MKITITAGHSNVDSGAVSKDRSGVTIKESEIVTDMRNMVALYLKQHITFLKDKGYNINLSTDGEGLTNKPLSDAVKLIKDSSVAVEFHLNASTNSTAHGTEALSKLKDRLISQKLCTAVSKHMKTRLRGDNGWQPENAGQHSRLAYVSNGGIILELFFLSNPNEYQKWTEVKWLVAKEVAQTLFDYIVDKHKLDISNKNDSEVCKCKCC